MLFPLLLSPVLVPVGGVPLLDPPLLPRDEEEDTVRITGGTSADGAGTARQKSSLPSQRFLRSARSFSSRFRSKAERYRSYDSRKFLSTRPEKISSPRGLEAGGIEGMGRDADGDLDRLRVGEGERERGTWDDEDKAFELSSGRGKKKDSGLKDILDRSGSLRTLKYMLNDLRARFACGTYLGGKFLSSAINIEEIS